MNYTEKNKLIDSLCGIALMLILAEIFYSIVDSSYTVFNYNIGNVTLGVRITGVVFLIISIILLIRAYKKENVTNMVYGLEFLVLAISAALLPGSYIEFPHPFNLLNKVFPIAFVIYYILKLLFIIVMTKKNTKKGKKK